MLLFMCELSTSYLSFLVCHICIFGLVWQHSNITFPRMGGFASMFGIGRAGNMTMSLKTNMGTVGEQQICSKSTKFALHSPGTTYHLIASVFFFVSPPPLRNHHEVNVLRSSDCDAKQTKLRHKYIHMYRNSSAIGWPTRVNNIWVTTLGSGSQFICSLVNKIWLTCHKW